MSKRILSELSTWLLAFALAFLVWIVAVREEDPINTKSLGQRVPVQIVNLNETLTIFEKDDLPSDIQVEIRAPQSVWQILNTRHLEAWIDLAEYGVGRHTIPIQVSINIPQATIRQVTPAEVAVQLEPQIEKHIPVTVIVNDEPPQGYVSRLPTTDPLSITVRGSPSAVNLVEMVVARVSLNNNRETVIQMADLSPRGSDNRIISQISLEPDQVEVTVPIRQRFGYKDVSVKALVTGQPAAGYWLSNISVEPNTVTLLGGPSALNETAGFIETAEIDVTGATEDVSRRVPLNLPPGVSIVLDEGQDPEIGRSVEVKASISPLIGGQTVRVRVKMQGVNPNYSLNVSPEFIEVILSGPSPTLLSLGEDDIIPEVDLFGLEPGTHRRQPIIIKPDGVEIISVIPDTVEVTLSRPNRTTPTPTLTATVSVSDTISVTTTETLSTTNIVTPTIKPTTIVTSTAKPASTGTPGRN